MTQTRPLVSTCCALNAGVLSGAEAAAYADLFKVLADPERLKLLSRVAEKGCESLTVNALTEASGLSQSTVSHHLKRLTDAGLLEKRRHGRSVIHTVRPEVFSQLRAVLMME